MANDEQKIACPNCDGHGWRAIGDAAYYECPMCEGRGMLVIDAQETMEQPKRRKPRGRVAV